MPSTPSKRATANVMPGCFTASPNCWPVTCMPANWEREGVKNRNCDVQSRLFVNTNSEDYRQYTVRNGMQTMLHIQSLKMDNGKITEKCCGFVHLSERNANKQWTTCVRTHRTVHLHTQCPHWWTQTSCLCHTGWRIWCHSEHTCSTSWSYNDGGALSRGVHKVDNYLRLDKWHSFSYKTNTSLMPP